MFRVLFSLTFSLLLFTLVNSLYDSGEMRIPEDWVDPHDMRNYDRHSKSMKPKHEYDDAKITETCECPLNLRHDVLKEEIRRCELFIERFINHLLRSARLSERHTREKDSLISDVTIKITPKELDMLLMFGKQFNSTYLNDLDQILEHVFVEGERSYSSTSVDIFFTFFSFIMQHKLMSIALLILAICFCALWMFVVGKSIFRIMGFVYLVLFLLGLIWNAWHMYEESVIKQSIEMSKFSDIPVECIPVEMSWFQYITYIFKKTDNCVQYHRAHNITTIFTVSPSIVLSETVSAMLLYPLGKLGYALNEFLSGLTSNMPWPLDLIFYPIFLVALFFLVLCIISLCMSQKVQLWSLIGGVSIGGQSYATSAKLDEHYKVENISDLLKIDSSNASDSKYVLLSKTAARSIQQYCGSSELLKDLVLREDTFQEGTHLSLSDGYSAPDDVSENGTMSCYKYRVKRGVHIKSKNLHFGRRFVVKK